jgi:hypothetical protein
MVNALATALDILLANPAHCKRAVGFAQTDKKVTVCN